MTPKGKKYTDWLARQVARRASIKAMHERGVSYSEIGRTMAISRQRARELVKSTP